MADHAGYCPCPVLRAQAEVERLPTLGMEMVGMDVSRSLVIAALRERYGCRGPGRITICPWDCALGFGGPMMGGGNRLWVVGQSGKGDGQYL
jgi:hypothetical protein